MMGSIPSFTKETGGQKKSWCNLQAAWWCNALQLP